MAVSPRPFLPLFFAQRDRFVPHGAVADPSDTWVSDVNGGRARLGLTSPGAPPSGGCRPYWHEIQSYYGSGPNLERRKLARPEAAASILSQPRGTLREESNFLYRSSNRPIALLTCSMAAVVAASWAESTGANFAAARFRNTQRAALS